MKMMNFMVCESYLNKKIFFLKGSQCKSILLEHQPISSSADLENNLHLPENNFCESLIFQSSSRPSWVNSLDKETG